MSQNAARHDPHATSRDEDLDDLHARRPEHKPEHEPERKQGQTPGGKPGQPVGQSAGGGGIGPDEPDDNEFELIGDDDLGPADLGPAAPTVRDPDAGSGRLRK